MRNYDSKHILNIALAGHKGSGKTSVAESMLYLTGNVSRLGKIEEGNTSLDYDRENLLFLLLLLRLNGKIQRLILSIHPDYLILPVVSQKV